jgi:NADH-quinone oxidoreductase subunit L
MVVSLWLIPFVPAAGAAINGLIGDRRLGRNATAAVACGASGLSLILSAVSLAQLYASSSPRVRDDVLGVWIPAIPLDTASGVGMFAVNWSARLDPFGSAVLLVVAGTALGMHLYAAARANAAPESSDAGWFALLGLLSACMLLMVLAGDFLVMTAGWQGVGLCLYALIGLPSGTTGVVRRDRAMSLMSGAGTCCLLFASLVVFHTFGTLDLREVANDAGSMERESTLGPLTAIAMLLLAAVASTTAHLMWRLRAGGGARAARLVPGVLLASVTMLAGLYLVARNAVLFEQAPFALGALAAAALGGVILATAVARRRRG